MVGKHRVTRRECLRWGLTVLTGGGLLGVCAATIGSTAAAPDEQAYPMPSRVPTIVPTPWPPVGSNPWAFMVSAYATPSPVWWQQEVQVQASVRWRPPAGRTQTRVLVHVGLYDTRRAVHDRDYPDQVFVATSYPEHGDAKRYSLNWSVPLYTNAGYYMVKVVISDPAILSPQPDGGPRIVYQAESLAWIRVNEGTPPPTKPAESQKPAEPKPD